MTEIRPFEEADLASVADLFIEVFGAHAPHTAAGVGAELRRVYLGHPWPDSGVPSLVADRDGEVIAFIGAVPMPMRLAGRPIRTAVGGNLMASPRAREPMATLRMLRAFFGGPQDLTLTDTASTDAVTLWSGNGGRLGRAGSLRWVLPLRPAALGVVLATRHRPTPQRLGRTLVRPIDVALARARRGSAPHPPGHRRPLDTSELAVALRGGPTRNSYSFDGDDAALEWLVAMCERKEEYGPLRRFAVDGADGQRRGVVLYYPNAGDLGHVLLLHALPGAHRDVLDHLRADALEHGSVGLSGQADPALLPLLTGRAAVYLNHGQYLTVHSADPGVSAPLAAGDIGVARLYSDWWTRFQGDVLDDDGATASA